MITARGLTKTYRGARRPALDRVSVSVGAGEIVAVVGHNGAGKSTLFDVLAGLLRADDGTVEHRLPPQEIGWCPQREVIDWSLTVRQNISLGLELRRGRRAARSPAVTEVCGLLGLTPFIDRQAETLSGGELRRTQIARAIAGDPRLLILDEPTTGLDPDAIREVFGYLESRAARGAAALISTHETSRFARHCHRVVALHQGRVLADCDVEAFMAAAPGSDDLWDGYRALTDATGKDGR